MRATHFGQLYRLISALLLCSGCSPRALESVAKLDYELPMVGARIVENRYLIGFDLESEPTALVMTDLQDPLQPTEVSRWPWPRPYLHCQFDWSGSLLYRHCEESGEQQELSIINVSAPFPPEILLKDESGLYDYDEFIIDGRNMYTLRADTDRSELGIWDISDPEQIQQLSSLRIPRSTFGQGLDKRIYKRGHYLIFGGLGDSEHAPAVLFSVDVADPYQPQIVSEYTGGDCESPSGFSALTANQQYLFIGRPNLGLCIVDISDPLNLHTVSVLREESPIISLVVEDSTLFMLGFFHLRIVGISNPERPQVTMRTESRSPLGIVFGDYFYALDDLYDLTEIYRFNRD